MKVTLMVNWKEKEILTAEELDKRIDARVEEAMKDTDTYNEYLDDFLDCNYTKLELFEALTGDDAKREEVLTDVRTGVAEAIYEWCDSDTRWDYEEVTIEA